MSTHKKFVRYVVMVEKWWSKSGIHNLNRSLVKLAHALQMQQVLDRYEARSTSLPLFAWAGGREI